VTHAALTPFNAVIVNVHPTVKASH